MRNNERVQPWQRDTLRQCPILSANFQVALMIKCHPTKKYAILLLKMGYAFDETNRLACKIEHSELLWSL